MSHIDAFPNLVGVRGFRGRPHWLFSGAIMSALRRSAAPSGDRVSRVLKYIDRVDQLLSDESKWTREAFARNAKGQQCDPRSRAARCWCLIGAISNVVPDRDHVVVARAFATVLAERGVEDPIVWQCNDGMDFVALKQWISDARDLVKAAQ